MTMERRQFLGAAAVVAGAAATAPAQAAAAAEGAGKVKKIQPPKSGPRSR